LYALGVLAGTERATAERRIERDQAFANLVEAWEERLGPLAEETAPVAPPPHVWGRIADALPKQRPQGDSLW
jgi:anti-sigma-K factor RskA